MTIKKDPVSWDITDGTLGTSGEYITSMEVSSMKTMSITKIALALLVSIPALSLNGAAVATTVAPSLWKSFCSRTEALASRAMSGIKSGAKAGFVGARNFVANHKVASQYSAVATLTGLAAFGAYKGYKWYQTQYQAKKAEPAKKTLTPAEDLHEFAIKGKQALKQENELKQKKTQAAKVEKETQQKEAKAKEEAQRAAAMIRLGITA